MDLEDARRKVLGMSPYGGGTAAEYLDARAQVVLAEERDRLAAAPTRFARALIEGGRTQAEVAEAIGVSPSLVGHWATGHQTIPEERINEVAAYLTMPAWGAEAPTSLALSYFGWVLAYVADAPEHRVAKHLGVTKGQLHKWAYGLAEMPEDKVLEFVRRFLPGQAAAYEVTT